MHLSLAEWFPLLSLFWLLCLQVSSVSNFCPDTEGKGGHLSRLTCSVVLRGGRNTANKYHWRVRGVLSVWTTLGLPPLTVCMLSWSILLRLQVALQGSSLKWALGCVHFPGLSCSGSGSQVLHKDTDLVGHVFCALPRSEQLRQPGAWRTHSAQMGAVFYRFSHPSLSGVPCVSSGELISGCDPPGRYQSSRIPGGLC